MGFSLLHRLEPKRIFVLLAGTCLTSSHLTAGAGKGGTPQQQAHAHHHHHHAQQVGQQVGQVYGYQLAQQGNYGVASRLQLNDATAKALDGSAAVDQMLQSGDIAPDGWMELKSGMAEALLQSMAVQESPEMQTSNADALSGSPQTGSEPSALPLQAVMAPQALSESKSNPSASDSKSSSQIVDLRKVGSLDPTASDASRTNAAGTIGAVVPLAVGMPGDFPSNKAPTLSATSSEPRVTATSLASTPSVPKENAQTPDLQNARKDLLARLLRPSLLRRLFGGRRPYTPKARVLAATSKPMLPKSSRHLPDPIREWIFPESISVTSAAENQGAVLDAEEGINWTISLLAIVALLGFGAGGYLALRHRKRALVHLLVPGPSEHFAIREAEESEDYVLDVFDAHGTLVRSAGLLRPNSVARAAVLPPSLAVKLGAQKSFDRFEFTQDKRFVATQKAEGYQIFPFLPAKNR